MYSSIISILQNYIYKQDKLYYKLYLIDRKKEKLFNFFVIWLLWILFYKSFKKWKK